MENIKRLEQVIKTIREVIALKKSGDKKFFVKCHDFEALLSLFARDLKEKTGICLYCDKEISLMIHRVNEFKWAMCDDLALNWNGIIANVDLLHQRIAKALAEAY